MQGEDSQNPNPKGQNQPVNANTPQTVHKSILNQTLGEILHTNSEAQNKIMQSMHINPQQFKELLGKTENSPFANMTIGELFKSGFVQQAVKQYGTSVSSPPSGGQGGQEVSPEEFQKMVETKNSQVLETDSQGQPIKILVQQQPQAQPQKQSFFQVVKGLFK